MQVKKLNVSPRQDDINTNQLRKHGYVPAIYYGGDEKPRKLTASKKELNALIARIGGNALYEIAIENDVKWAILKDVQRDPVTKEIIHVDFLDAADNRKISMSVPLKFEGTDELESKGIILQRQIETINVEGCVNTIPSYISVNVGNLKVGESIRIGDLKLGNDIQVLDPLDKLVAVTISAVT